MDWPLLDYPSISSWSSELKAKEGVRFKMDKDRIKLYFGHKASGNEVIEAYHLDEV